MHKLAVFVTLNQILGAKPCVSGLRKLVGTLGRGYPRDKPINILTVLDSNGIIDFFWLLSYLHRVTYKKQLFHITADMFEQMRPIWVNLSLTDTTINNITQSLKDCPNSLEQLSLIQKHIKSVYARILRIKSEGLIDTLVSPCADFCQVVGWMCNCRIFKSYRWVEFVGCAVNTYESIRRHVKELPGNIQLQLVPPEMIIKNILHRSYYEYSRQC